MKFFKLTMAVFTAFILTTTSLVAKQELVRGNGAEPGTLDPGLSEGVPASNVIRDLFETLMSEDREGNVILGQAESYTISDDKLIYTFKIRKDAKWSNGDDVTANDFAYSFRRTTDPKTASPYSWYLKILGIKNTADIIAGKKPSSSLGVKAINSKTLKITLGKPIPYFLMGIAHPTMAPVPQKVIEKYGKNWTKAKNMVSNGAYKLKEWVVNEKIVLVKNDKYYNADKVKIDKVTFLGIPDEADLSRYKAGEIDMLYQLPSNQYKSLLKTHPKEIRILRRLGTYYYSLNMKKKKFKDIRVRKALSYAVNRDVIAYKILGTGQKPAYTFVPDNVSEFNVKIPPYAKLTQKQRDKQAKKMLNDAGFSKSKPLKFEILYNTSESHKRLALTIASMWKKAFDGAVIVTLRNQEWKTYLSERRLKQYDVLRAGWVGDYNEASTMLDILTIGHSSNNGSYENPEYNKVMNKARGIVDSKKRNKLYQKADAMIVRDVPIIPLYQYSAARLVKPHVGGYPKINPLGSLYTKYFFIKK